MDIDSLNKRVRDGSLRRLQQRGNGIDLYSNDYLGLSKRTLREEPETVGSTGSRLLSGNSNFAEKLEDRIAEFHNAEAALIFNSGYDANIGLLSSIPSRHDTVIYDELVHASIRDGVRLGYAKSLSFKHNDLNDLKKKLQFARGEVFIVVESLYSMDGDLAPLSELEILSKKINAKLIVDEAHAIGVFGGRGEGLCKDAFARIYTYGKALGCHGAAVVGSQALKQYLVNFARSFIYTTALPLHSLLAISEGYTLVENMHLERENLIKLSEAAGTLLTDKLQYQVLSYKTQIVGIIVPDNAECIELSKHLEKNGILVSPILSPTVQRGAERLRVCLHSYNNIDQINTLCEKILCYRNRN